MRANGVSCRRRPAPRETEIMKLFFKITAFSLLGISSTAAFSYQRYSYENERNYYENTSCQVNRDSNLKLNFSQKSNEKNVFVVGWNLRENHEYLHTQKPELGGEIVILRCLPPGRYVLIAKGSVDKLNGSMVEAQVNSTNYDDIILGKYTQELVESKNLIWRPMVGDEVLPVYKQIEKVLLVSPKFQLSTNDLFRQQEGGGSSLTLSDEGQNLLKEKFEQLKNRNGRLLVEGFILTTGNRDKLRTESLMRAQTVSAFLIHEFSLQPSQVVPIGYGNDWMQTGMQPAQDSESGIVLKMLNE